MAALNWMFNPIKSKKINIDYGVPPGTQTVPPPDGPIEKPQQQQPADLTEKVDSIDDFIRFVRTFKTLKLKPTLQSDISIEIVTQSKQYVKYVKKYTLVKCYEIMRDSIQNGKLVKNVCTGFANLSKLANCIYFAPNSEETRIIKVDSVFYQDIYDNLCNTDDIFQLLGYENMIQFWQLNDALVEKSEAQIERVFCELCLVVQECNAVERQIRPNDILGYLAQMIGKSTLPGLPPPTAKPKYVSKPKTPEVVKTPEVPEAPEEDDDQYALSELQVAIDSVQTLDPTYKPSLAEAKPDELFEEAQKCVRLPTKEKYQLIQMYELIKSNLLANKTIQEIILGLTGVFKYAYCQLFDLKSPEIQDFLFNEDLFYSLVSGRIINYQQIFLCIGYIQLNSGLGMVLNIPERNDVTLVCCELLIGIQELNEIDRSGQDLMEYFGLRKPISRENLGTAQSVQPAESGPGQPQRPQPLDRHQHQEPNRTDNVPVSQQTVPTHPPLQRQLSPLQAVAPQQAICVSPRHSLTDISTQSTDQPQVIIEFKARIQSSRNEIQTKFLLLFDKLKEEELRLLTKLDEIESDVIDKFNVSSATLTEILLAKENILGILKSNTTNTLLKNTLEMYDKEIEDITKNSAIKSTRINLNWKLNKLGMICEMNEVVDGNFNTKTVSVNVSPRPESMEMHTPSKIQTLPAPFRPDMPTEVPTAAPSTAIKYCDKCHQPNRMQDVLYTMP